MAEHILRRHSSWQRLRWNLLGILLCSMIPYALRLWTDTTSDGISVLNTTLIGSILASLIGMLLVRSLSSYPGVQSSAYIVPSFVTSYGIILFGLFFGRFYYTRSVFIASFVLAVILFYISYFRSQRREGIVIGVIPIGAAEQLTNIKRIEWRLLHSPDDDASNLSAIAADLRADLPDAWERRLTDYALQGLPVYHSKQLMESLIGQVELEHLSENSFGSLSPVSAYMTVKHSLDWLCAAIALFLFFPWLLIVALAIRLDSHGAAIFRQMRVGYQGKPFMVYKFRTMTVSRDGQEDARSDAMTKSNDQRVTRIGRFLRSSRLDELPQLLNVLKGDMSWIGPRPEAEVLSRWYEAEIPFYHYRHIVRPGISGWAQVSQGHVADVEDVRQKLHYDFYYIKHFSLWLDILIVARTIRTIVTGFGAR